MNMIVTFVLSVVFIFTNIDVMDGFDIRHLKLPDEHIPPYLYSHRDVSDECKLDENCPYKDYVNSSICWGYEPDCQNNHRTSKISCSGDIPYGWAKDRDDQIRAFWNGADFGYVKERINELTVLCQPETSTDSSLVCAKYTRYCRATDIYIDLASLEASRFRNRYREDVLKPGQIGGRCKLFADKLKAEGEHKSPLQSWFAELEHFTPLSRDEMKCDVTLDRPTIVIKLDAAATASSKTTR